MARLYEFIQSVRGTSRDAFAEANPHPFLLLRRHREQRGNSWTFKTQTVSVSTASLGRLAAEENLKVNPEIAEYEVYSVTKALSNPWPERISVGRARNNDIVLPDSSVSKLHAHFRVEKDGRFRVSDAGSRNGTRINEERVPSGEAHDISVGDQITFGRTEVRFVDSNALHDLVTQYVEEGE